MWKPESKNFRYFQTKRYRTAPSVSNRTYYSRWFVNDLIIKINKNKTIDHRSIISNIFIKIIKHGKHVIKTNTYVFFCKEFDSKKEKQWLTILRFYHVNLVRLFTTLLMINLLTCVNKKKKNSTKVYAEKNFVFKLQSYCVSGWAEIMEIWEERALFLPMWSSLRLNNFFYM